MWNVGNDNLRIRELHHYLIEEELLLLVPVLGDVTLRIHYEYSRAFQLLRLMCLTCFHMGYNRS